MQSPVQNQRKSRNADSIPSYRRIESDLRNRVETGHWPAGVALPSRLVLAREYGVDLRTLQKAIAPLLSDGILNAKVPTGTFVAERKNFGRQSKSAIAHIGIISRYIYSTDLDWRSEAWPVIVTHAIEKYFAEQIGVALHCYEVETQGAPGVTMPGIPITEAYAQLKNREINALMVVLSSQVEDMATLQAACDADGIPVIFVTASELNMNVTQVTWDHTHSGYLAATHLIERGYLEFIYFCPVMAEWAEKRFAGIRVALLQANISTGAVWHSPMEQPLDASDSSPDFRAIACNHAHEVISRIARGKPVGVIAANDNIACGLIEIAEKAGLRAGRDYGLVSFDGLSKARSCGLTSIHPPLHAAGHEAARLLMAALNGEELPKRTILPSYIVPRATSLFPPTPFSSRFGQEEARTLQSGGCILPNGVSREGGTAGSEPATDKQSLRI